MDLENITRSSMEKELVIAHNELYPNKPSIQNTKGLYAYELLTLIRKHYIFQRMQPEERLALIRTV